MTPHYHFIGIGGIGMSALAHILLKQKVIVSGSDKAYSPIIDSLIQNRVQFYNEHNGCQITSDMIVVYSSDIKADNPEFVAAKQGPSY